MKKRSSWQDRDPRFREESGRYEHPIPSREFILQALAEAGQPLGFGGVCERLGVKDRAVRQALTKRLGAMVRDGQLLLNRADEYCLLDRLQLVVGIVSGHKDGFGFLRPEGGGDDVFLAYRQMRQVMHGDRIAVRVTGEDPRGRKEGALVEVLERRTREVAGRFTFESGVGFIEPDNRRISHRIVVPADARGGAKSGDLVVAEIVEPPTAHADPVGRVTRILPEAGAAGTAIELAIASHGLSQEFPPAAIREARRFGKAVPATTEAGRVDLRKLPLVTIDGEDARDFDDAVYAEATRSGFRLLVAIADVSHYVEPGSALDGEARERATSVYFPGRVIPMLPEQLSNHLCSLMPEVERLCMVCDMHVASEGKVTRTRFYPGLMRSAARLTYTRVAAALVGGDDAMRRELAPALPVLETLHEVYRALRRHREARGALDFEAPEVKVLVDEGGQVTDIRAFPRNDAHRLIEECMIAANVEAAKFLKKHKMPALFRIHGVPEEERIADLKRFLAMRGVHLETGQELEPARLQKVLQQVVDRPDAAVLENAIIRSLPQALYQPLNIGHFGLALSEYVHFTSPIRRYPDLLVHRAIRHAIGGGTAVDFEHSAQEMETLGQECSLRERKADEAARSVVAFLKCEFMKDRVGQEFDAVATGVTDFGVFVQLKEWQVDGLVHVTSLPRDYFRFHEADRMLVGERSGQRYGIGDELRVRLVRVDPADRKIDFELIEKLGAAFHPRKRQRKARRK
ncbi:MAG TPA: ribonuclease R [Steroidobacteraceae bacterium]|nr:ribonuclease R [Steroidobacteraceae bacterium]